MFYSFKHSVEVLSYDTSFSIEYSVSMGSEYITASMIMLFPKNTLYEANMLYDG